MGITFNPDAEVIDLGDKRYSPDKEISEFRSGQMKKDIARRSENITKKYSVKDTKVDKGNSYATERILRENHDKKAATQVHKTFFSMST